MQRDDDRSAEQTSNTAPSAEDRTLIDGVLEQFVLTHQGGEASARALEPWLSRLPESMHGRFIERVMLYLSLIAESAPLPTETDTGRPDATPDKIDRYDIEALIAQRTWSTVFRAFDPQLRRTVAIKQLHHNPPQQAERLLREARALANLEHPHLVRVLDCGESNASPFVVMEFIDGPDLSQVAPEHSAVGVRRELRTALQLAEALAYMHSQGVIHRDVKPSNALLRPDGSVALADFGLVRILEQESTLTGPILGTPLYMAPELAIAPQAATGAADVYSLGCMLASRLSGSEPFAGKQVAEIFAALVSRQSPFPQATWRQIPKDLAPTLRGCIEPSADDRPTAAELAGDLRTWLEGKKLHPGLRSTRARTGRSRASRRWFLAAAAGIIGAMAWGLMSLQAPHPSASSSNALDAAIALLFDHGDLDSVLDPITLSEEGYSPLASTFLRPAKKDEDYYHRRLIDAEQLLERVVASPETRADLQLTRACLACANGDSPDKVKSMLGELRDHPAGMALLAECWRQSGDDEKATDLLAQAAASDTHTHSDATKFFVALARFAALETDAGQGFSYYTPRKDLSKVEIIADDLTQARAQAGRWKPWTTLLLIQARRLLGELDKETTDLQQDIAVFGDNSFLGRYFTDLVLRSDYNDSIGRRIEIALELHKNSSFNHSKTVHDVLISRMVFAPVIRNLAIDRWKKAPDRNGLFFSIHSSALALGEFSGEYSLQAIGQDWIKDKPKAAGVWTNLAIAHFVCGSPLADWNPEFSPYNPFASTVKLLQGARESEKPPNTNPLHLDERDAEHRTRSGSDLSMEFQEALGADKSLGLAPGSLMYKGLLPISIIAAARRGCLAVWIEATSCDLQPPAQNQPLAVLVGLSRIAGEEQRRALDRFGKPAHEMEQLIVNLLEAEAALGPINLGTGSELKTLQGAASDLGVGTLWSADQEAKAWRILRDSLTTLRHYKSLSRRDRLSRAGAAWLAAHLRAFLAHSSHGNASDKLRTRDDMTLISIVELIMASSESISDESESKHLVRRFR